MAYRIEYPGPVPGWGKTKRPLKRYCLTILLVLALLASTLLPAGRRIWMDTLIPGEDFVTHTAVSNLINEMRQGEDLEKAFWAFCEVVLYESM